MVKTGPALLGRVIDGLGHPLDGGPEYPYECLYPLFNDPPSSMTRKRITEPVDVGVRVINALLTLGKGQRMGVFAGSGVGKSTLLSMVARHTTADVSVVALVGERGREVREFIERDLGQEGLKRSVVVVATSDQPALLRIRAAFLATAVAEYFRDQGRGCGPDDGQRHPFRPGRARSGLKRGRASHHQRLSALGIRPAAPGFWKGRAPPRTRDPSPASIRYWWRATT